MDLFGSAIQILVYIRFFDPVVLAHADCRDLLPLDEPVDRHVGNPQYLCYFVYRKELVTHFSSLSLFVPTTLNLIH